jgi:hypothetical protein
LLLVVEDRLRVLDVHPGGLGDAADAFCTALSIRAVMENWPSPS